MYTCTMYENVNRSICKTPGPLSAHFYASTVCEQHDLSVLHNLTEGIEKAEVCPIYAGAGSAHGIVENLHLITQCARVGLSITF